MAKSLPLGSGIARARKNRSRPSMLKRWAARLDDRNKLHEFLTWLEKQGIYLARQLRTGELVQESRRFRDLLDKYHGIDAGQLELERRGVLAKASTDVACSECSQPIAQVAECSCDACFARRQRAPRRLVLRKTTVKRSAR